MAAKPSFGIAVPAIGAVEGQWFKKTGVLVSLSEQQLIDCSSSYYNRGCSGGYVNKAFQYTIDNGGLQAEDDYPYEEKDDTCRFNQSKVATTVSYYVDVYQTEDEDTLKHAVGTIGPISASVDASSSFQFYGGGIYDNPNCNKTKVNHSILIVGCGSKDGHDYWIVKNSYGLAWGESGYIYMSRNKDNQCGITNQVYFPQV